MSNVFRYIEVIISPEMFMGNVPYTTLHVAVKVDGEILRFAKTFPQNDFEAAFPRAMKIATREIEEIVKKQEGSWRDIET